jgi:hypothetical protein
MEPATSRDLVKKSPLTLRAKIYHGKTVYSLHKRWIYLVWPNSLQKLDRDSTLLEIDLEGKHGGKSWINLLKDTCLFQKSDVSTPYPSVIRETVTPLS